MHFLQTRYLRVKRGLAILLVTGVVFSTVIGCGGETDKADGSSAPSAVSDSSADSESSADSGETYEVGYIVSDMSHEWYQNICKGAERRAEDKGIDLSISDAAMDASQQISFAENYINQGVDALIITPVDPAGLNAVVALAEEAGIPLIAESSKFDGMDCFVGIGDFEAGERMGEWMADYAAENDIDMNILIVGQPALEACRNRVDGFKAGLDNKGAEYTVAQEVDGNGTKEDSLAAATDALTAHPEVNVIFGINDNSSTGAMNAYIENGLDESKLTTLASGSKEPWEETHCLAEHPINLP